MNDKAILTGLAMSLLATTAFAGDLESVESSAPEPKITYPFISGTFVFELENDYVFSAYDGDEFSDTFNTTEVSLGVQFNRIFSLRSDLVFEAVDNPDPITGILRGDNRTPGENIFFEDHGLFF